MLLKFLFTLLLIVSYSAPASEDRVLTWGFVNFEPYHYVDNGKVKGRIVDVVDDIFSKAALQYSPVQLPNKRTKLYFEQGKVDFTIVIDSFVKDQNNYLKSKHPFYNIKLGAICKNKQFQISSLDDLKGLRLILLSGYTYGLDYKLQTQAGYNVVMEAQTHNNAISALAYDRADCALGYQGPFLAEQQRNPNVSLHFNQINEFPVHLYLNKNSHNAKHVMQLIDEAH